MSILVTPRPGNHDPSLPDWGPYSKKYFGISHIADKADAFMVLLRWLIETVKLNKDSMGDMLGADAGEEMT